MIPVERYQGVFFDLDGTTMDTLTDIQAAFNHTMRAFGLSQMRAEALKPLLGYGARVLMDRALPDMEAGRREEVLTAYRRWYAQHSGELSRPYPGILDMMRRLSDAGLKLAILSNKPDGALQPLARTYFKPLVPVCEGERPGIPAKPNPEMLIRAAERLGVDLHACLYVGDSEVDIQTAQNARMNCASVTWGFRDRASLLASGAEILVDRPEQIVEIALGDKLL